MLIICSECGKEYSDQAKSCPHCGAITSQNRYISNNIGRSYIKNRNSPSEGIGIVKILLIIIAIIIVIFFIKSTTKKTDSVGKSTTDYDYLLKNKPSYEQITNAKEIDYRSLYKGVDTLNGNFYKITGEIVQVIEDHLYHINMTKSGSEYYTYYTDRIQISLIGTPSEVLMEGDIVSFTGESLGNYTYTAVMGNAETIPFLRVYAENLKVIGHTD